MTEIICKDLSHTYPNGVEALSGVNVSIKQVEIISVVGQNGSGKTTLVKHFNGLLKPSGGNVLVGELDTLEHSVGLLAREVGYVFQNPNHQIFAASVKDELSLFDKISPPLGERSSISGSIKSIVVNVLIPSNKLSRLNRYDWINIK